MTTAYNLSDTAPKDSGGAKFLAFPNVATSQNDFALPAGIGASTIGTTSKIHAALQVGTHVSASKVSDNAQLGVLPVLAYTANPSSMAIGNATPQRGNQYGEAYFSALSSVTCAVTPASRETVTATCGTLFRVMCAGCGLVAGAQISVMNGGTSLAHFVFSGANDTLPIWDLGTGTCFGSLVIEKRGSIGDAYVTMNYRAGFSQ